jgi:hypothetical protein
MERRSDDAAEEDQGHKSWMKANRRTPPIPAPTPALPTWVSPIRSPITHINLRRRWKPALTVAAVVSYSRASASTAMAAAL